MVMLARAQMISTKTPPIRQLLSSDIARSDSKCATVNRRSPRGFFAAILSAQLGVRQQTREADQDGGDLTDASWSPAIRSGER
jgi:hypothetical protein